MTGLRHNAVKLWPFFMATPGKMVGEARHAFAGSG